MSAAPIARRRYPPGPHSAGARRTRSTGAPTQSGRKRPPRPTATARSASTAKPASWWRPTSCRCAAYAGLEPSSEPAAACRCSPRRARRAPAGARAMPASGAAPRCARRIEKRAARRCGRDRRRRRASRRRGRTRTAACRGRRALHVRSRDPGRREPLPIAGRDAAGDRRSIPELDAKGNAASYFARYRKSADALPHLERRHRRAASEARVARRAGLRKRARRRDDAGRGRGANSTASTGGKRKRPPPASRAARAPLRIERPSGARIFVGRSPRENVEVTFRIARPDDLWFHARGIPGSHVVLQAPPGAEPDAADLDCAADFAALHSRARNAAARRRSTSPNASTCANSATPHPAWCGTPTRARASVTPKTSANAYRTDGTRSGTSARMSKSSRHHVAKRAHDFGLEAEARFFLDLFDRDADRGGFAPGPARGQRRERVRHRDDAREQRDGGARPTSPDSPCRRSARGASARFPLPRARAAS